VVELVRAEQVRGLLGCIEAELAAAIRSRPSLRGSRLVRLRVLLVAAQHADMPMDDVCRQVCEALTLTPPRLR
jgi:hypothetical protein